MQRYTISGPKPCVAKGENGAVRENAIFTNGTFGPIDHLNSFPGGVMYHESVFSWYIGSDAVSRYFPGVQGGAISVELPELTAEPCAECSSRWSPYRY